MDLIVYLRACETAGAALRIVSLSLAALKRPLEPLEANEDSMATAEIGITVQERLK